MVSTPRALLRLHIEAVWGVQLPPLAQNTVELLREGIQPPWKLYAAEMAGEQVVIWRPDVAAPEREALLGYSRIYVSFYIQRNIQVQFWREIKSTFLVRSKTWLDMYPLR